MARASRKTLAELIRWYIDKFYEISRWQRTKQDTLELLEKHSIGKEDAYNLSVGRLVRHVRARRAEGTGPATVGIDLTYIGVVLETAQVAGPFPVDPQGPTVIRSLEHTPVIRAFRSTSILSGNIGFVMALARQRN
jgi:hypothetical protein